MKKLIAILLVLIFALFNLTGCNLVVKGKAPIVSKAYTSVDGLPPIRDDLKQIYTQALNLYYDISLGKLKTTQQAITVNGTQYFKVQDDRFKNYDDFVAELHKLFTKEFVQEKFINASSFTKGSDGSLYMSGSARGADITYAGHAFEIVTSTDTTIDFIAIIYHYKPGNPPPSQAKPFYVAPQDTSKYEVTTANYFMKLIDNQWKFSIFSDLY